MNAGARRALGGALLAAGLVLAALGGYAALNPVEPPYRYEVAGPAAPPDDPDVADALTRANLSLREARLVDHATGRTLAELRFAEADDGPVMLDWRPKVDEPFLLAAAPLREVAQLAAALRRHVPADALVLAWWDTSRQLALLAGTQTRFDRHVIGAPLALPAQWVPARSAIEHVESAFWLRGNGGNAAEASPPFGAWVDAMLASPADGAARLRALAGKREAYAVVHVRDALLLGAMAPQRLGVALREQPDGGNLHGAISGARDWMRAQRYAAYSAYAPEPGRVRVLALTDEASAGTLIAGLLPFHDPIRKPEPVPGMTLVHQVGGFWVYRIEDGGSL
ncbi:MAG: hydroxylamine oxidation protein HaoB [Burkholderiales bacterium]|nr:hydroxylamine oxidation protein HaoB [Burkholderiales bacterium]ODU66964.1 MAG: hydroxylamine oxidation protein HaoB [Lautropia sp. SCN 66-9]